MDRDPTISELAFGFLAGIFATPTFGDKFVDLGLDVKAVPLSRLPQDRSPSAGRSDATKEPASCPDRLVDRYEGFVAAFFAVAAQLFRSA
jgi:hypothetical protein